MEILKPNVHVNYYMRDAYPHWSICDDSMNVSDENDNMVCVNGVKAAAAYSMCHSIMCCGRTCFEELEGKSHQIGYAKEMIGALQTWLAKQEAKTTDKVDN